MAGTEELTLLSSGAFVMGIEFTLAMPLNIENTYLKKKKRRKVATFLGLLSCRKSQVGA